MFVYGLIYKSRQALDYEIACIIILYFISMWFTQFYFYVLVIHLFAFVIKFYTLFILFYINTMLLCVYIT